MANCRDCDAPLKFIKSKKGKWLPCNPEEVELDEVAEGTMVVLEDGDFFDVKPGAYQPGDTGFVPHWKTCPKAERRD